MPRRRITSGDRPASSSPSRVMRPSLGRSSPLMTRSTVDLPAPLGPTMQVIVCSAHSRSTLWSTLPPPYPAKTAFRDSTSLHHLSVLGGFGAPVVAEVGVEH